MKSFKSKKKIAILFLSSFIVFNSMAMDESDSKSTFNDFIITKAGQLPQVKQDAESDCLKQFGTVQSSYQNTATTTSTVCDSLVYSG
jgi:hypothetical protein